MSLIQKYIWVIETIYRTRQISLKELSEKWMDTEMSGGSSISRQTFDRWKTGILDIFGIIIDCNLKAGYKYFIYNPEVLREGELNKWLLDSFSTINTLSQSITLKNRILVEEIPSSKDFLKDIIGAMRDNKIIELTYKGFQRHHACTFPIEPYCLKMFQKRWYILTHSINDDEIRLYAMDRIESASVTDTCFTLPKDFDAKSYFASFFGIVLDKDIKEEKIVLRADRYHQHYLRTLPLHPSQREIYTSDEYADFELHLRPTYIVCMELLKVGAMIEVLEPQSLRHQLHGCIKDMWKIYEND